jgi:hypothetical protein
LFSREFLPPIHGQTVEALEETTLPSKAELLTTVSVQILAICQQLVREMTVEYNPAMEEDPEEGYTRRELVDDVDVTLIGKEEQVEHKIQLPKVCEENVEVAK